MSRAYSQAAAKYPAWRIPPPITLRNLLASVILPFGPSRREPTGAPKPLDTHIDIVSNSAPMSFGSSLVSTITLKSLAPSKCRISPLSSQTFLIG